MTREAPEPPGSHRAPRDRAPDVEGSDTAAAGGGHDDRLASLLSVDIGDPATAPRRRRRSPAEIERDERRGSGRSGDEAGASGVATRGGGHGPRPAPVHPAAPAEPTAAGPAPDGATQPATGWRVRSIASWAMLCALLLGGVGLVWTGASVVRNSTEGRVVAPVDDPTAPGFEALVDTTPTMAVLHDLDGSIDAITVLTLPDPEGAGGGVVLIPTRTVFDMPLYERNPIEVAYDLGSADFLSDVTGQLLGAAMNTEVVVDAARWAELVEPVAPIVLDNTDALEVDGDLRFPVGEIELEADDVGPYLEARVEGQSELARLFRHQTFWAAWLDAIAAADAPEAVPGEVETGIGRFVRTIAAGAAAIEPLPVEPARSGRFGDEAAFEPRFDEVQALVEDLVPLPASSAPGARARVRILNGTDDTDRAAAVAPLLTPAGVEIVLIGNAPAFGVGETTITYVADEFRDEAEEIADLLGVGEVSVETRPSDVVDITVTLGADYG